MPETNDSERSYFTIPKKGGIFIPAASIGIALSVLAGAGKVWEFYEERKQAIEQEIVAKRELEARLSKLELWIAEVRAAHAEKRIDSLEQWQCRLGWNPPETRDSNRECHENEDEVGE